MTVFLMTVGGDSRIGVMDWLGVAAGLQGRGVGFAVATVIAVAGSAPRHSGAKMVITMDGIYGSVGGGNLEEDIIRRARAMIADADAPPVVVDAVSLAATMGQCCGGKVAFIIEKPLSASVPAVAVFGAGHIGQGFARLASLLPCRVRFLDSRREWLDKLCDGVDRVEVDDMAAAVASLAAGSYAIVMTHSHSLDMDIVAALLAREDIPFVGLVGSASKSRRFVSQLQGRGLDVSRLCCPMGGKANLPSEVAIKMAGVLIDVLPQPVRMDAKSEAATMRELAAMVKDGRG